VNKTIRIVLLATLSTAQAIEPTLDAECLKLLRLAKEPTTIHNTAGVEHYRQSFSVPLTRMTEAPKKSQHLTGFRLSLSS
jgi:hypothetical protein